MTDESDSKTVGKTVEAILAYHGDQLNVFTIPKPHQTVLAVNQAHYRITNGGFQFLLERDDISYDLCRLMADAHELIGAKRGHRAFSKFLRGFLWICPTATLAKPFNRLRLPLSIAKALLGFETADTLYFDSSEETYACLAEYIRSNLAAFPTSGTE
jgi:hypothetical protein